MKILIRRASALSNSSACPRRDALWWPQSRHITVSPASRATCKTAVCDAVPFRFLWHVLRHLADFVHGAFLPSSLHRFYDSFCDRRVVLVRSALGESLTRSVQNHLDTRPANPMNRGHGHADELFCCLLPLTLLRSTSGREFPECTRGCALAGGATRWHVADPIPLSVAACATVADFREKSSHVLRRTWSHKSLDCLVHGGCDVCPSHELRVEERRFRDQKTVCFFGATFCLGTWSCHLSTRHWRSNPCGSSRHTSCSSGKGFSWLLRQWNLVGTALQRKTCFPFAVHKAAMC